MTEEKAIDLLDNLIGMIEDNQNSDYDTALKMGIKALEQEPTTKNDLGVDCILRVEVMQVLQEHWLNGTVAYRIIAEIGNDIQHLPSVTPQEPKKGHWISRC